MTPVNLKEKLQTINTQWHPHQIAEIEDMQLLLAKVEGDFVWHKHEEEDELFFVIRGTLQMQFRDRTEEVREGELIVVPKGVEHCPSTAAGEEVHLLLFEKKTTKHTGTLLDKKTKTYYPKI
jgi:mannose-6-phosphate isomerase-like protein (cupin superfamily)